MTRLGPHPRARFSGSEGTWLSSEHPNKTSSMGQTCPVHAGSPTSIWAPQGCLRGPHLCLWPLVLPTHPTPGIKRQAAALYSQRRALGADRSVGKT